MNGIGELFRNHAEEYIAAYHPNAYQAKLIRDISRCKTPEMGGHVILCKDCGHKHYIFHSCGHSHCMICQAIKREQWVDKLKASLLEVPYVHMTFTLPHQLNMFAKWNKSLLYSMIMKVAWLTIQTIGKQYSVTYGMTSVLHTFGSDMKYHIHVHSLVTFGGLSAENRWIYPPLKNKIAKYRSICSLYKKIFLHHLDTAIKTKPFQYPADIQSLFKEISQVRWVVHSTYPTMDTHLIQNYLGRYINRVAITNNRLSYIKDQQQVGILYNDYKQQSSGQAAPKAIKYLDPLSAIHQILQHILPPYFQKSRRYGLHHPSNKAIKNIPSTLKNNNCTIRTVFQIIHHLLQITPFQCEKCNSKEYNIEELLQDEILTLKAIFYDSLKAPPLTTGSVSYSVMYSFGSNGSPFVL